MNLVLFFQVQAPTLPPDATLKVTGSISELGEWMAVNAVTLVGSGEVRTAGILVNGNQLVGSRFIGKNGVIEYKYVVVRRRGGGREAVDVLWEDFDGNRTISLANLLSTGIFQTRDIFGLRDVVKTVSVATQTADMAEVQKLSPVQKSITFGTRPNHNLQVLTDFRSLPNGDDWKLSVNSIPQCARSRSENHSGPYSVKPNKSHFFNTSVQFTTNRVQNTPPYVRQQQGPTLSYKQSTIINQNKTTKNPSPKIHVLMRSLSPEEAIAPEEVLFAQSKAKQPLNFKAKPQIQPIDRRIPNSMQKSSSSPIRITQSSRREAMQGTSSQGQGQQAKNVVTGSHDSQIHSEASISYNTNLDILEQTQLAPRAESQFKQLMDKPEMLLPSSSDATSSIGDFKQMPSIAQILKQNQEKDIANPPIMFKNESLGQKQRPQLNNHSSTDTPTFNQETFTQIKMMHDIMMQQKTHQENAMLKKASGGTLGFRPLDDQALEEVVMAEELKDANSIIQFGFGATDEVEKAIQEIIPRTVQIPERVEALKGEETKQDRVIQDHQSFFDDDIDSFIGSVPSPLQSPINQQKSLTSVDLKTEAVLWKGSDIHEVLENEMNGFSVLKFKLESTGDEINTQSMAHNPFKDAPLPLKKASNLDSQEIVKFDQFPTTFKNIPYQKNQKVNFHTQFQNQVAAVSLYNSSIYQSKNPSPPLSLAPKLIKTEEMFGAQFPMDTKSERIEKPVPIQIDQLKRAPISKDDDNLLQDVQGRLDQDFNSDDELDKVLLDQTIKLDSSDQLIVVSFKLPLKVIKARNGELQLVPQTDFLSTLPNLFKLKKKEFINFLWVGWPDYITNSTEEKKKLTEMLKKMNCIPIWLPEELVIKYQLVVDKFLTPIFNNFKVIQPEENLLETDLFKAYREVNQQFTLEVVRIKRETDMIWIHDLMLMARYVRRYDLNASIGFYMHLPFPCSEVFARFQFANEIAKCLLFSDVIGFYNLTSASMFENICISMFKLNKKILLGGSLGLEYNGRTILIKVKQVGISNEILSTNAGGWRYHRYRIQAELPQAQLIISSIDLVHPFSNLETKLVAYQHFLRSQPGMASQVCLIQYLIPPEAFTYQKETNHQSTDNQTILDEHSQKIMDKIAEDNFTQVTISKVLVKVNQLVDDIHKEFGESCLVVKHQFINEEERYALWSLTNVYLSTSVFQRMIHFVGEFIQVRHEEKIEKQVCVLMPDYVGGNRLMKGAYFHNPVDAQDVCEVLAKAISQPLKHNLTRLDILRQFVKQHSILQWSSSFLTLLKKSRIDKLDCEFIKMGFGTHWTILKTVKGFKALDLQELQKNYQDKSVRRLIILDLDLVLPHKTNLYGQSEPTEEAADDLEFVAKDPLNQVYVISSRQKHLMKQWYQDKAPHLGLVAEDGFFWKENSLKKSATEKKKWNQLIPKADFAWIKDIYVIFKVYCSKIEGSTITTRESSITWNYENSNFQFARMYAQQLSGVLKKEFCRYPIRIVEQHTSIKVTHKDFKSEKMIKEFLQQAMKEDPNQKIDFVLYIGQDPQVFRFLNKMERLAGMKHQADSFLNILNPECIVYTVCIGKQATKAKYFIEDQSQMLKLLQGVVKSSQLQKINQDFNQGAIRSPMLNALRIAQKFKDDGKLTPAMQAKPVHHSHAIFKINGMNFGYSSENSESGK